MNQQRNQGQPPNFIPGRIKPQVPEPVMGLSRQVFAGSDSNAAKAGRMAENNRVTASKNAAKAFYQLG